MPSIFVFDAYGTLFDVHAAIARFRAEAGPEPSACRKSGGPSSSSTPDADARRALRRVLDADRARARLRAGARPLGAGGAEAEIAGGLFRLDAFPDARAALARAQGKGHAPGFSRTAHPRCCKAVEAAGIGGDLDAVLSVDMVKMFKPRPQVYRLVTDHFRCAPDAVTFVSSNRWT